MKFRVYVIDLCKLQHNAWQIESSEVPMNFLRDDYLQNVSMNIYQISFLSIIMISTQEK